MRQRTVPCQTLLSTLLFLLAACSGGGGSGSDGFQLVRISFRDGAVMKVNQEIIFTFNQAVDFSSVSLNTINIQTPAGAPATGSFFLRGATEVVFQPNCPMQENLSDTGLMPGGQAYVVRVLGRSSSAGNTVRSMTGAALDVSQVRGFTTDPDENAAFLDTAQGPPVPVLRTPGSSDLNATYMEIGGDPDNRVYFDSTGNTPVGFLAPLNLYSAPASRIAVVIAFNQALYPSADNVETTMRLEFLEGLLWLPIETRVTLEANCTETGARVRLEPIGILPQGTQIRAVVLAGLQDLPRQDATLASNETFAVAPTQSIDFTSLSPNDLESDEVFEPFTVGGDGPLSLQDTAGLFEVPTASWSNGQLTSAFAFGGTGGPGGTFDWLVESGDDVLLDTTTGTAILGADGQTIQVIQDGVLDLRNLTIEPNATVRVQGSRPLQVFATGTVIIRGTLDVSGFAAQDVNQLNTGDVTEVGGARGPGGGEGGSANEVKNGSTPRGSFGQGPSDKVDAGGQGGETGWAPVSALKDARRPGGGAGGRFAPNQGTGLTAENGLNGSLNATGAITNAKPPLGGVVSSGPFVDGLTDNNFFGTKLVGTTGNVTSSIRGELTSLWGGYGGGGGGNADPASAFPTPNWTPASDEKGGAGGGGGGGLSIRALGPIQFGAAGLIRCDGGKGALGENVQQQDHVGGNGGSGSGGHVVLETASYVDFTDGGAATTTANRDWIRAVGGPTVTGTTTSGGNVSFGGAGGPGVLQLHVPRSLVAPGANSTVSDIVLPGPALGAASPIDAVTSPPAVVLLPTFASNSRARSRWISIGGADHKPGGATALVKFLFQGIDTTAGADQGKILVSNELVPEQSPLLDDDLEGNAEVAILPDRLTLRVTGSQLDPFAQLTLDGISNDLYLRTPDLMEDFILRLSVASVSQDFRVASATYDEGAASLGDERLELTVVDEGTDLQDFVNANTGLGVVAYRLIPRFFRVVTGGIENSLPANAYVRIRFQAAGEDAEGQPDEQNLLVDWTGDIVDLNNLQGLIQFFRFEVEFELNEAGGSVDPDTQPISLDFLRIPFVF